MKPFSFIHTADLHLDSPFTGLRQVDGTVASLIKDATFRGFDNVVDLALRHQVDFFLVAGDVYNSSDRSLRAQTPIGTIVYVPGHEEKVHLVAKG